MNTRPILTCLLAAALAGPVLAVAGKPEADSSHAAEDLKDSALTAAVKTRLPAGHAGNITQVQVDADQDGIVWLSGSTRTQEAADRAVENARNTDGVVEVKSTIVVARETK